MSQVFFLMSLHAVAFLVTAIAVGAGNSGWLDLHDAARPISTDLGGSQTGGLSTLLSGGQSLAIISKELVSWEYPIIVGVPFVGAWFVWGLRIFSTWALARVALSNNQSLIARGLSAIAFLGTGLGALT